MIFISSLMAFELLRPWCIRYFDSLEKSGFLTIARNHTAVSFKSIGSKMDAIQYVQKGRLHKQLRFRANLTNTLEGVPEFLIFNDHDPYHLL